MSDQENKDPKLDEKTIEITDDGKEIKGKAKEQLVARLPLCLASSS
jgi:hypothetical protein